MLCVQLREFDRSEALPSLRNHRDVVARHWLLVQVTCRHRHASAGCLGMISPGRSEVATTRLHGGSMSIVSLMPTILIGFWRWLSLPSTLFPSSTSISKFLGFAIQGTQKNHRTSHRGSPEESPGHRISMDFQSPETRRCPVWADPSHFMVSHDSLVGG